MAHRGEGVRVDLENVHQLGDALVPQGLVDLVLAHGMADVLFSNKTIL
jgi:hypothetical protein